MIMKQARARRIQCLALGQSVRCLKARVVVMVVVVRRSFSGAGRMPTRTRGGSSRELSLRSSNAAGAGTFFSSSENDLLSWMTEYFTNMYVVLLYICISPGVSLFLSYMQIYNDEIFDLLSNHAAATANAKKGGSSSARGKKSNGGSGRRSNGMRSGA